MGLKNSDIRIFKLNNSEFEILGVINQFNALQWSEKYLGFSSFELFAPITEENTKLLKKGNILWCGSKRAGIIEIVKTKMDESGNLSMDIKGRTLEMLLTTRIMWNTYTCKTPKKSSTVIYEIVKNNLVEPKNSDSTIDTKRKIPFLELSTDKQIGGDVTIQRTGGDVYTTIYDIASDCNLGFDIEFDPINKKLVFDVFEGIDRSLDQKAVDPILFTTDMEDILKSLYYMNDTDYKNMALIEGELPEAPEGQPKPIRKRSITGDIDSIGFDRRELYVDARDIRMNYRDDTGQEQQVTEEEYAKMLNQRGDEKLSTYVKAENFEATIRTIGNVRKEFGKNFNLGDLVTISDKLLNVTLNARIVEVVESLSDEYTIELVFGYQYPSIFSKVERML